MPARRSLRRFAPTRQQRLMISKRQHLLQRIRSTSPLEFLPAKIVHDEIPDNVFISMLSCIWCSMRWLPGTRALWRTLRSPLTTTMIGEWPAWPTLLNDTFAYSENLDIVSVGTQTCPTWYPPYADGLRDAHACLTAIASPKLGGKRAHSHSATHDQSAEHDAVDTRKRRHRSRTPARQANPAAEQPPSAAEPTRKEASVQTDRMIEEVHTIAVRVLGRVPITYDLHMQDMIAEAYDMNQGIISPAVVEKVLLKTYKRELVDADRLTFVAGHNALVHNRSFPDWMLNIATLDAIPSTSLGATGQSPSPEVFRQAWQIAQPVNATFRELPEQTLKFLLRSQPKLCSRLLGARSDMQICQLMRAAAKRAAIPAGEAPSTQSKASVRTSDQNPSPSPAPPQVSRQGESRADRWRRSQKSHDEKPLPQEQWRTVTRRKKPDVLYSLIDEWSVPVVEDLHWGSPGILYSEDATQAKLWAAAHAKATCAVAVASRTKLGIESETCKVERLAFHVDRSVTRGEHTQSSRQILVGYIYHLSKSPVYMSKKVLQSTPAQVTTSVVIRLSTMEKYCPGPQWSALLSGDIKVFRDELVAQLPSSVDPTTCIHDLFQLRRQGLEMAASMRVSDSVLQELLRVSGKTWVFVQPPYMQANEFPIIWAGDAPESTKALYQKSLDLGALGLVLGHKKLGYRTTSKDELAVRNKLALPASKIWLISGIPLAMTQPEIMKTLDDMGMKGVLIVPSRRQQRMTQSWQLRANEHDLPKDDVLKLQYNGRDYWITIAPFVPVRQVRPVIQVYSRRWQRRSNTADAEPGGSSKPTSKHDSSPAVGSKAPMKPSQPPARVDNPTTQKMVPGPAVPPTPDNTIQALCSRLDKLEQLVHKLVSCLDESGKMPPPSVPKRPPKRKPWADLSSGADFGSVDCADSTMGQSDSEDDFNDKWCEGSGEAKRYCVEAQPSELISMNWFAPEPVTFQQAQWGRVSGDGNCLWRAIAVIADRPWQALKEEALAALPEIRPLWLSYFRSEPEVFDQTAASMHALNAHANEIAFPCISYVLSRPIVVHGTGQAFSVYVGNKAPEWKEAMVVALHAEHFSPLSSPITDEQAKLLSAAAPMHICVELRGGASAPVSSRFVTWNCSSLQRHAPEVLALEADLVCLQETGLTLRAQKRLSHEFESAGYSLICGAPTPLMMTKQGWRPGRGAVPGVAVAARRHLDIRESPPITNEAKKLVKEGRMLSVSVKFRTFRALLFCLYCTSGWGSLSCDTRANQMNVVVREVASHKHIPILLAGDWNDPPSVNVAAGLLGDENYHVPLMQDGDTVACELPTHLRPGSERMLDYWLFSPHLHLTTCQSVNVMPGHEHAAVSVDVPVVKQVSPSPTIPNRVEYDVSSVVHPSPTDWNSVSHHFHGYLSHDQSDLAFAYWSDAVHRELAASSASAPREAPGVVRLGMRQPTARLTTAGEEGPVQMMCAKFARRLFDWAKSPTPRVLFRLQRDWPVVADSLHLNVDQWDDLMYDPIWGSELITHHVKKRRERDQSRHVRKWQRSLTASHGGPTGHLYRWLRAEAVSPPLIIMREGERIEGLSAVFQAHREYWEGVSSSYTAQADRESIKTFLSQKPSSWVCDDDLVTLRNVARSFNTRTAGGLDSWPSHVVRLLSDGALASLLLIFRYIESGGGWPSMLHEIRVALVPKPESDHMEVSNWRPISITSVVYRLYTKWRLVSIMPCVLPNLSSSGVVGGLPTLRSEMEVLELAVAPEAWARQAHTTAVGIAMDATKCFDKVPWPSALSVCRSVGFPDFLVALFDMYLGQKRHTSLRGYIDTCTWNLEKGILQGCPISVLVLCSLVSSWHSCLDELGSHVRSVSFVDDRLLTATNHDQLLKAWSLSLDWDRRHHWVLNPKKSCAFSVGLPSPQLSVEGDTVPVKDVVRYLGVEVPFKYNVPRSLLELRYSNTMSCLKRSAQLPKGLSINARARAIEVAAMSEWAYGIVSMPPPQQMLSKLATSARRALWAERKAMHSFHLVSALVFRPHRLSPWGASVYSHVMFCLRALHHRKSHLVDMVRDAPTRTRMRGPIQVMFHYLSQCSFTHVGEWRVSFREKIYNLCSCDMKCFGHSLREGIRLALISLATRKRPHLRMTIHLDLPRTVKFVRRAGNPWISEMVTLLCDGLWQGQRLFHAGKRPSKACPHCSDPCEDTTHVLWHCPKWASHRVIPEDLASELLRHPMSATCGHCLDFFSQGLLSQWENVQRQCAQIIRSYQEQGVLEMQAAKSIQLNLPPKLIWSIVSLCRHGAVPVLLVLICLLAGPVELALGSLVILLGTA